MAVMIIGTAKDAAHVLEPFFSSVTHERVAVIHLNGDRDVLALTFEDTGSHDLAELPIGGIIAKALRLGATAIVVAHNHPSGDATPSAADEAATRALAAAAASVDIRLQDHLVFANGDCRSFRGLGLL